MARGKKPANGKVVNGVKRAGRKLSKPPLLAATPRQAPRRPSAARPPRTIHAG